MNKSIKIFLLITCLFLLFSINKISAQALVPVADPDADNYTEENDNDKANEPRNNNKFTVVAELINDEHTDFMDIQITVTSNSEDFDGTARLNLHNHITGYHAFDTVLSLPANSTKQFIVSIPIAYADDFVSNNSNFISFHLVNKKHKPVFSKRLTNSLLATPHVINVGILSDNFNKLSFLDLYGNDIEHKNIQYNIKLWKLDQKNIDDSLYNMQILLIDNYDMNTQGINIKSIHDWVSEGGCLYIGTGEYVKKVLSDDMNTYFGLSATQKNNYDGYDDSYINANSDHTAIFYYNQSERYLEQPSDYLTCVNKSFNFGFVAVFPFSFEVIGDIASTFENDISGFAFDATNDLYTNYYFFNRNANRHYAYDSSSNYLASFRTKYLSGIDKFSSNFSLFRMAIIIILYLIIISPLLYFILKKIKKQELYWLAIPSLSLLFVIIIYFAGLGFNVSKIVVHSISSIDSTGSKAPSNYFYAYNASKKEYRINLADNCTDAAMVYDNYVSAPSDEASYNDLITKSNNDFSIRIRPEMSFENKLGLTNSKRINVGNFELSDKNLITNNTGYDFDYILVYKDDSLSIYDGIKNNESLNINDKPIIKDTGSNNNQNSNNYSTFYTIASKIEDYYSYHKDRDACSFFNALCFTSVEICDNDPGIRYFAVGVTKNINPVTNKNGTNETNYSCVYTIFN